MLLFTEPVTHFRAELADSRMLHNTYTHQIEETRQQTSDNIEEKKVLQVKCENAKVGKKLIRHVQ